jgi:hypothetical protein
VQKFAEKIGFISSRKRKELAQLLKNSNNPNYDVVPSSLLFGLHRMVQKHIEDTERTFSRSDYHNTSNGLHILQPNYLRAVKKGISKNKIDRCFETCGFTPDETLSWLSEDYLFDEIAEAKDGFDDLFDICVENEHAYWTNGFISHNSTILEAISLLNWNMTNRGYSLVDTREAARNVLRQYVYDQDYQPAYERLKDYRYNSQTSEQFEKKKEEKGLDMLVEGIFDLDGKEYAVQLTQDGYVRNDFAPVLNDLDATDEEISTEMRKGPWGEEHLKYRQRMIHHISSDNDLSMSKFQLHYPMAPKFDDIIELIMRFPTHCIVPKGLTEYDQGYCTDIVVDKVQKHRGDRKTRVHYKRFSAGERKICKSFSQILNLMYDLENPGYNEIALPGWPPILLMDNIEMHVYFDRHVTMVDRVKEVFQKQQVFVTTHSGILVPRYQRDGHDADSELYIDLEPVNG